MKSKTQEQIQITQTVCWLFLTRPTGKIVLTISYSEHFQGDIFKPCYHKEIENINLDKEKLALLTLEENLPTCDTSRITKTIEFTEDNTRFIICKIIASSSLKFNGDFFSINPDTFTEANPGDSIKILGEEKSAICTPAFLKSLKELELI